MPAVVSPGRLRRSALTTPSWSLQRSGIVARVVFGSGKMEVVCFLLWEKKSAGMDGACCIIGNPDAR